jgi:hypothetical protein
MTPAGAIPGPVVKVPANSRVSVDVGKMVPAQYNVSTKVTADHPVIAERAVYWNNRIEGHDSVGVTSPSPTWYMAEGSTAAGSENGVLMQNPGDVDIAVDVVFMTPTGEVQGPKVTLKAHARTSINVTDTVPANWSVSTKVTASHPVICERSVYWSNRTGGTNSIGAVI